MWFSLPFFPTLQYVLHPSKKLLPAIVIRAHTSLLPDPLSLQSPSNVRDTKQKPRGIY